MAACSSSEDSGGAPADAATADTGASDTNAVQKVTCPATVAITVTTNPMDYVYAPNDSPATIRVGDVVHFRMASIHNVTPTNDAPSDPGLSVPFGGEACLKFTKGGTFNFICAAHAFRGKIVVQ